jgi:hypothetical protein
MEKEKKNANDWRLKKEGEEEEVCGIERKQLMLTGQQSTQLA